MYFIHKRAMGVGHQILYIRSHFTIYTQLTKQFIFTRVKHTNVIIIYHIIIRQEKNKVTRSTGLLTRFRVMINNEILQFSTFRSINRYYYHYFFLQIKYYKLTI